MLFLDLALVAMVVLVLMLVLVPSQVVVATPH
jgi:hypothetical protein